MKNLNVLYVTVSFCNCYTYYKNWYDIFGGLYL